MSSKKRFENIEAPKPDDPKKPSILDRFSFKRKLEIEGVEREKLPEAKLANKSSNQAVHARTKQGHQPAQSRSSAPVPTVKPILNEAKAELDSLAKEIEFAEQRKRARETQKHVVQVQQKVEQDKKLQLEEAKQRADSATSKILLAIIGIPILAYIVIQAAKSVGAGQRGGIGSELIWLIVAIVLGGYGRNRWNRW